MGRRALPKLSKASQASVTLHNVPVKLVTLKNTTTTTSTALQAMLRLRQ